MEEVSRKNEQVPTTSGTQDDKTTSNGSQDISLIGNELSSDHKDIVTFSSEGKTIHSANTGPSELDAILSSLRSNESDHNLTAFLARPVKLDKQILDSSYNIIFTYRPLQEIYKRPSMSMVRAKLDGFYGMKCTFNLKVVANPQPFQAGIYVIYFVPGPEWAATTRRINAKGADNLAFATGCPHVILNLATQSEVTLSIPYVGLTPFIDLTKLSLSPDYYADPGAFYCRAVAPMNDSTSSPVCEVSVYMYFTEVELFGATNNDISELFEPQMFGSLGEQNRQRRREDKSFFESLPYGRLLSAIGTIGGSLLEAALSRPVSDQRANRMQIAPVGSAALYNTTDTAFKLSLDARQNVKISQMGITTNDEMNIVNYVSLPGYLTNFTWSVGNAAGRLLAILPVNPQAHHQNNFTIDGDKNIWVVYPNRLRYIANLFKYWRGSIRYTFHIAATKFHSGRLRIQYTVGSSDKTKNAAVSTRKYAYILDIRDGQQFTIEVPYIYPKLWQRVPHYFKTLSVYNQNIQGFWIQDAWYDFNTIEVYVENELLNSPNTSNNVQVAVFSSGGPDIQFAGPMIPQELPENGAPADDARNGFIMSPPDAVDVQTPIDDDNKQVKFKPQGLVEDDVQIIDITTGKLACNKRDKLPTDLTIGESITNLRQLIRRWVHVQQITVPTTTFNNILYFYPYQFCRTGSTGILDKSVHPTKRTNDYLIYLMKIFMFYRGGIRYMFSFPDTVNNMSCGYSPFDYNSKAIHFDEYVKGDDFIDFRRISQVNPDTKKQDDPKINYVNTSAIQPLFGKLQGLATIEIPFYNALDKCYTTENHPSVEKYKTYQKIQVVPDGHCFVIFRAPVEGKLVTFQIYRATADDFNLGYAIGPPPTAINVWSAYDMTYVGDDK